MSIMCGAPTLFWSLLPFDFCKDMHAHERAGTYTQRCWQMKAGARHNNTVHLWTKNQEPGLGLVMERRDRERELSRFIS